jgi:DNA-binding MarR family transcriptional regulator
MTPGVSQRRASEHEQGAWHRLAAFHSQVSCLVEKVLQERFGLSLSEYTALEALAGAPDPECPGVRMQALADAVGLNQSSVSRLVARLERQDLVRRTHCDQDRRGVFTHITEPGRRRLEAAAPVYARALGCAFDRAMADPELREMVERITR